MADPKWTVSDRGVEASWPSGFFDSDAGRGLEPLLQDWITEGGDALALSHADWAAAGTPAGDSAEEADLFQARHAALARLLGISAQHVAIESVGHVGAPELSFLVSVDGVRLGDMWPPSPEPRDGRGRKVLLLPAVFVVFERVCLWNRKRTTTRAQQLVFVGELRALLDRVRAALEHSGAPVTYELDPHLAEFHAERVDAVSLAWADRKNGALFELQVQHVDADGQRAVLDLNRLDPEEPMIELGPTSHIFLDRDVAEVARAARKQRNKLRKHVEQHFHSPADLLPEGVSLDRVDLSAYSPRVIGFEPIRADRDVDIQSSGIAWHQDPGDVEAAFLRLFIAQPGGGVETLALATPEVARAAVEQLDRALQDPARPVIDIAGRRVAATRPLRDRIDREITAYDASVAADATVDAMAAPDGPTRLAAKISDDTPDVSMPAAAPVSPVAWDAVAAMLLPGIALKPHQIEGVEWMWRQYQAGRSGVLLADDMGLGKTLQIATFLALQMASGLEGSPSLIVAPVILLDNWREELRRFFRPEVFASLIVLHGEGLARHRKGGTLDVQAVTAARYVLTNYDTLQSHQLSLLMVNWNVVVLDEAQHIKNSDTARARAARGLKRRFGIAATGTPVENRLSDLWSIYDFLSPHDPFGSIAEFTAEHEGDVDDGVRKARAKLAYPGPDSSLLRRTKAEALTLPPKTIQVHTVAMTPAQVELERQIVLQGKERTGILGMLGNLQKLYQHPHLLASDPKQLPPFSVDKALADSPKLALCVDILQQVRAVGEKALVFTLWTHMQAMLVEVLKAKLGLPRVRVINGDPKLRKKTQEAIGELSATSGFDVLVLSPLAAGTGLTITAANHVIHYGRWWNPAKEDQATDRAYRIGQTRPVTVHYPILHHPDSVELGFDVSLHALVTRKRAVARDFLAPQNGDDITAAELAALQEQA